MNVTSLAIGKQNAHDDLKGETDIFETLGYVLSFFNFCTGIVATLLDLFVIYILLSKRGISRTHGSDMFVVGLTFTDLISGTVLIFSIGAVFFRPGRQICLAQVCCIGSSMLCSALFVSLMTSDRYFKIVHPFLYQRVFSTEYVPIGISASVYIFSFVIGFLPMTGVGAQDDDFKHWSKCNYLHVIKPAYRLSYLVLLVIPIPTAVLLYRKIFNVAKSHIRSIAQTQGGPTQIPRGRYIKMIFIMAGLYTLFYTPPAVLSIVHDITPSMFNNDEVKTKTVFHVCAVGLIVNPVVNAIIYAYTIPLIKNTFRQALGLPVVEKEVDLISGSSKMLHTSRLLSEGEHTKMNRQKKKRLSRKEKEEGSVDSKGHHKKRHSNKGKKPKSHTKHHKKHKKKKRHKRDSEDTEEGPSHRISRVSRQDRRISDLRGGNEREGRHKNSLNLSPSWTAVPSQVGDKKLASDEVVQVLGVKRDSDTDSK